MAVDENRLYATTDAKTWAEEFAKVCPEVDQGLMIGWFANAIETAKAQDGHENERLRLVIAQHDADRELGRCDGLLGDEVMTERGDRVRGTHPLKFEMPACSRHWAKGHKWWCRACDRFTEGQMRDAVHALWELQGAGDRIVR